MPATLTSAAASPVMAPPAATANLRIGFVGAGRMAQDHVKAILRISGARVAAVADPALPARVAMRALVPEAEEFDSLESMLAADRCDVIHVCTPPSTHFRLAAAALQAGRHVYVEKPFVESSAEAAELLAIAERRGLKVAAGHQLLFESPTRVTTRFLPAIGKVVHVESYFAFRTVRRAPGGRVPLRPDLQLLDILPHPVYVLLHFLEKCSEGRTEIAALEVSETGTVHALLRRGHLTGTLVVTLEGRPVESYARLSGTNGALFADYVRGTVQRQIGPGSSGIDKALSPFRTASQLVFGTTRALGARALKKQRSYPGLVELFEAFYDSVRQGTPPPMSPESLAETTRIWEQVATKLEQHRQATLAEEPAPRTGPAIVVTGGTGFLGKEVVSCLVAHGDRVRVLARREPASWERVAGAEYAVADLGVPLSPALMADATTVIHAAAETAGGWEEHQRNSIDATANVLRAAAAAGVRDVIHLSSIAVLAKSGAMSEATPLAADGRTLGPYVWGKLESERMATDLGRELGLTVRIARPGPIVDSRAFEPPGRLGKRVGNLFIAVGSPGQRLPVIDVRFAARVLTWMAHHGPEAPAVLNLVQPELPTKRELLAELRRTNPDLRVVWLPTPLLFVLSGVATVLQKVLRPRKAAVSVRKVFAVEQVDTSRIAELAPAVESAPGAR